MTKPQSTPPGFKELEFRENESGAFEASGPFGSVWLVWKYSALYWACRGCLVDGATIHETAKLKSRKSAVQAANEHCHKELGRWVQ